MHNADWLDSPWEGFFVEGGANLMKPPLTGLEEDNMAHILSKVSSISVADFVPHSGIKRILKGEFLGWSVRSSEVRCLWLGICGVAFWFQLWDHLIVTGTS